MPSQEVRQCGVHQGCPLGGLVEGRVRVIKRINFLGFKKHRWLEWRRQKTTNFSEGRVLRNTQLPNKNLTSTTQKTPVAVYHKHTGEHWPPSWQRYNELSVQLVLGSWTSWEIGENRWMNLEFWGMPETSSCSVSKMKVYPGNWKLEVASQFTSISMLDTCWILKYMLWLIWWYMKGTFQSICWFVTLKHNKIQTFYPKYHNPLFLPESDVLRLFKCTVAT